MASVARVAAITAALIILSLVLSYQHIATAPPMSVVGPYGEVKIPIEVKPAHDICINVTVKALRGGHFEASLISESGAYIKGEDFILKSGESHRAKLFYYFAGNVSKAYIRIAAADGRAEYDVKYALTPRFDDGIKGDAPNSCEAAPIIGSLSGNGSSLGFNGFLTGMYDTDRGLDQSDYYKIHIKTDGEASLTITAEPINGSPRLELWAFWAGYRVAADEADTNDAPVSIKVKYVEAVEGDLCLRVSSAHIGSYHVNITLIEYASPAPPPEHPPVQPPTDFLPYFWVLIILLTVPLAAKLLQEMTHAVPADADARTAKLDTAFGVLLVVSLVLEGLIG